MAQYSGNGVFLSWDGTDISGYWTGEVDYNSSVNLQDVTAGAGADYTQNAGGLLTQTMGFTIVYDDTDIATYVQKLNAGREAVLIYGPEGNTAGKPKFERTMILQSVAGPNPGIEKPLVSFELTFEPGKLDPVATIEGGSTF